MNEKLNKSKAREIRVLRANGLTLRMLSHRYNVSTTCIWDCVKNLTYHDSDYRAPKKKKFNTKYAVQLRKQGRTYDEIARSEQKRMKRDKPYSISSVRDHLITVGAQQKSNNEIKATGWL